MKYDEQLASAQFVVTSLPAHQLARPGHPLLARLARWQDQVREPALSLLLLGQVITLFVAGPLKSAQLLSSAVMGGLHLAMLVISYFVLPPRSKSRVLILVCVGPLAWTLYAGTNLYVGLLLNSITTLVITVAVAQAVFRAQRVTRHQLLGAVVVYLNLALLFVSVYQSISWVLPGAFASASHAPLTMSDLKYFSLTTITSTGYGDIVPVHPLARSLANFEAVIGQLFVAILLARLVSEQRGPARA